MFRDFVGIWRDVMAGCKGGIVIFAAGMVVVTQLLMDAC